MNNISKSFSSVLNVLETANQAEINMISKIGEYLFKQGIPRNLGTNPYMSPYVEKGSCGEFFLTKILQKSSQRPTKVLFFSHKNK